MREDYDKKMDENKKRMAQRRALLLKGCICPICEIGKKTLYTYPDFCPYISSLEIKERVTRDSNQFNCPFFVPLKTKGEPVSDTAPTYTPPASVKSDNVNHPDHYTTGKYECIDYIEDKLTDDEFRGYIKGNVLKYLTRERHKNGNEDILKAQFYLNRLCNKIKGDENNG